MVLGISDTLNGFAKVITESETDPSAYAVDAIFKDFYLPGIRDQLNNKRILSRLFARDTEHIQADGKWAVIALNVERNESSISIGELGRLPEPEQQVTIRAHYQMRWNYGRVFVTGPSMGSSRTNRGSFIRALDYEMQGMVRDRGIEDNRIYWGDGRGVRSIVTSRLSNSTFTCQDPGGFTNPGPGTQYLRPGMRIGFIDPAAPAVVVDTGGTTGWRITAVDAASSTITVDTTTANLPATIDTYYVVRVAWEDVATSDVNSTSFLNEPFGVAGIVNDDNPSTEKFLGMIDATGATSPGTTQWQSAVVQQSGVPTPFSQGMLDLGLDAGDIVGDGTVNIWMTSHGIRRQYLHELISNKRYVNQVASADGSFKAVEHNGIPMVVDRDATRGRIYGLDVSALYCFDETDYFWIDGDNSVLHRDPNRDAYSATLARYCECGTDKRNAHVLIKDIADA